MRYATDLDGWLISLKIEVNKYNKFELFLRDELCNIPIVASKYSVLTPDANIFSDISTIKPILGSYRRHCRQRSMPIISIVCLILQQSIFFMSGLQALPREFGIRDDSGP